MTNTLCGERRMTNGGIAGLSLILISAVSPAFASNGFKAMAKELGLAARASGVQRVAVLPFAPTDGGGSEDGLNISEKLVTQMVRAGHVQMVERSLLSDVMAEHRLAQTGMIDQTTVKRLGGVRAVEGIVTGSFATSGKEVMVHARLINVETGIIIAALESQVELERADGIGAAPGNRRDVFDIPVPELFVKVPPLPSLPKEFSEWHDAPANSQCEDAASRVDQLESQILDIKARYWALQLKKGISLSNLKINPGSTITDPLLKRRFYEKLQSWYESPEVADLTPSEAQRFSIIGDRAYALYRDCGI